METAVLITNLTLAAVIAGATVYYAVQTRWLVSEARTARRAEAERERAQQQARDQGEVRHATMAMVGAANDVVGTGSVLAELLRRRRVWRVRAIEPLNGALLGVSRALDRLRHVGDPSTIAAAEAVFDDATRFYQAATAARQPTELEDAARRLADSKAALITEARADRATAA